MLHAHAPPPSTPLPPDAGETTRDAVLRAVQADEGVTKSRLAEGLGIGWGTVCYHLDRLERDGAVQTLPHGRTTLVFPRPRSRDHMEEVAVRRRPPVPDILGLLDRQAELTIPAVMEHAGVSRYLAKSCLDDLERVGLVVRVGRGHPRYRLPAPHWSPSRGGAYSWSGGESAPPVME